MKLPGRQLLNSKEENMKKFVLVLLAVLFVFGLAVNSGAADMEKEKGSGQHGMYRHEGCYGHSPMEMFKKLGLDEKQKAAIREIHFKTRKAMIMKKADVKVAKLELQQVLSKDPVDMSAAEAAVKKIESLKAEMKMMHIKAIEEIKSNLNDEQKKEFSSMVRQAMMKREMMGHGMMGHGECGCGMHEKKHGEKKHDEKKKEM
jgi:Spy/CpxP family protein refolding chaperone